MQVALIREHGGPEVLRLEDHEPPTAGPDEVLVRVLAVSVNHLDLWVRRGMPGMPIPMPRVLGCDGTGEVVALGDDVQDCGLAVGQKVVIEPGTSSGASDWDRAGLDPVHAAAMPLTFLTAWGMLVTRVDLEEGERVLVLGGTSGVGVAAIQIAKRIGAEVIATAGTPQKRELCLELGADHVIDHHQENWSKEVKGLTGGGVDVVVEHVGPATWGESTRCLARNGRLVTCGGTTGPKVDLVLPHLFMKNLSVLGSTMGPRTAFEPIFAEAAAGNFRPVVHDVLPLSEIRAAHEALEAGEVLGKLVLVPGS